MSKLYGYLEGDNSNAVTRAGNNYVESTLQTTFVRTKTMMTDKGETLIRVYKCHGRDNQGELLSGVTIDKDGTIIVHSGNTNP